MGRPLDLYELKRLVAAAEEQHVIHFVQWMIGTCARPSTIYELMTDQIKYEPKLIDLNPRGRRQTKKYRPTVKLPERLEDQATERFEHAQHRTLPVISYRGAAIRSIKKGWNAMRDRAGLDKDVKPYSLRHTMARYLRSQSVPPWEVAAQLGHKLPGYSTTEIYAPYDPAYLEKSLTAINRFLDQLTE